MVHQGQSFALRLEPCDDVTRVHTRLDDFQGDTSMRRLLLGKVDRAHASFRNEAQNAIRADEKGRMRIAGHCALGWRLLVGLHHAGAWFRRACLHS